MSTNISDYFKQAINYIPIIKSVFMYMSSSYYIVPNVKQNKSLYCIFRAAYTTRAD